MADLILPPDSPFALALREPSLLVPGQKPLSNVKLDLSHPINNGCIFFDLFGPDVDIARMQPTSPTLGSGSANVVSQGMVGTTFDGTANAVRIYSSSLNPILSPAYFSGQYTWMIQFYLAQASPSSETLVANSINASAQRSVRIMPFVSASNTQFLTANQYGNWADAQIAANPIAQTITTGVFILDYANNIKRVYYPNASGSTSSSVGVTEDNGQFQVGRETTNGSPLDGTVYCLRTWGRALSETEALALVNNPYLGTVPANDTPFIIGTAAGGPITGTGALSAQASSVAGTGEITHTGTGALSAQTAAVVGTGAVSGAVTGTGALSSQAAAIAGVGEITHTGTGALSAQTSALAGVGEITHTGTGALSAQASALAGTGTTTPAGAVSGTGALASQVSQVAGAGVIERTATGALIAQSSIVVGSGVLTRTGTGALSSQTAQVAGTGSVTSTFTGTGALASAVSTIAGTGTVTTPAVITGTGALVCGSSSISGVEDIWIPIAPATTVWTEI